MPFNNRSKKARVGSKNGEVEKCKGESDVNKKTLDVTVKLMLANAEQQTP
jgi:hypothetical protein